jgi:hypothetical protein
MVPGRTLVVWLPDNENNNRHHNKKPVSRRAAAGINDRFQGG